MSATKTNSTPVLVVGGGLVGLSAALFLTWRGVQTVLVEKHPGSSPHPRALGYSPRTMELFRQVGLEPVIPQNRHGVSRPRRIRVESLAGEWFEETQWTPTPTPKSGIEYSPCSSASIAQDRLEPILRDRAIELGADLRLETELTGFEQDSSGVTASLRERNGTPCTVRADYLVAADGLRSSVREALGIGRRGVGHLRTVRSVMFRVEFDHGLQVRIDEARRAGFVQFAVDQPDLKGMVGTYGDGRWLLMLEDDEERTEETLKTLVRRAIGRSNAQLEIITTGRWEVSALVADRFASSRVFLVGDAAHVLPPNRGGYGANTGIEDAHNLAWKLAAVVSGASGPALLDSYDAERRPVAWLRHDQIFARPDHRAYADDTVNTPIIDDDAMEFGHLYRSTAVIGAGSELPSALRLDQWAGQPGTRAPHLWVTRDGKRESTLDVVGGGWVLLAHGGGWDRAAARATRATGVMLQCLRVGVDIISPHPEAFRAAFGLGTSGASLVRPDGYVAWRATELPTDPAAILTDVLRRVASVTCAATEEAKP